MAENDKSRHRTIGISMHPGLHKKAIERAKSCGLTLSRYVALCLDAELSGKTTLLPERFPQSPPAPLPAGGAPDLDLEDAIVRGGQYMEKKTLAIDFENDVEDILDRHEFLFTRMEKVARTRTDFLIRHVDPATDKTHGIALECSYNVRRHFEVTLGQCIILRGLPAIDAVILAVPYLQHLDPHMIETFKQQDIPLATPDTLHRRLNEIISSLS